MDVKLKISDLSALFDLHVMCGVKEYFDDGDGSRVDISYLKKPYVENEEEGSMLANELLAYFGQVSADFVKGMNLQTYLDNSVVNWNGESVRKLRELLPGDKKSYIVFVAGVDNPKYSLKKVSNYAVVVRLESKLDSELIEDLTFDTYQRDFK